MMETSVKIQETRVRRIAKRRGFTLTRSRGRYWLTDARTGGRTIVDAELDAVEGWLSRYVREDAHRRLGMGNREYKKGFTAHLDRVTSCSPPVHMIDSFEERTQMAKKTTARPIKPAAMSALSFKRWMTQMGFNHSDAAKALGASRTSIIKWSEAGAPKVVKLACAHLASGGKG